ncbi:MAG: type II secretion system protein [Phycisphaerae bacterium]|nr:type II secretion system protein [Phycisphaerae bacterium]
MPTTPASTGWMRRESARGFSLIELLVVIAVIALLIGILLPALGKARGAGRRIKCQSQMRQLATAVTAYSLSNKEQWHVSWNNNALRFDGTSPRYYLVYPFRVGTGNAVVETDAYWAALYDTELGVATLPHMYVPSFGIGANTYLAGWEVTRCPDAKYSLPMFRGQGRLAHDPYTLYSSYGFNGVTPGSFNIPLSAGRTFFEMRAGRRVPRKLGDVEFPSGIVFFQDSPEVMLEGNGDALSQMDQWDGLPGAEGDNWDKEYFRHGTCNVAFADSHVGGVTRAEAQNARADTIARFGGTRGVPLAGYSYPGLQGVR